MGSANAWLPKISEAGGAIRDTSASRLRLLEPETPVGRAASCVLRLAPPYVSQHHAVLRWHGARWQLKDLGSRNGTFLHGTRLRAGAEYPLRCGAKIAFGKADETWELVDESAPAVMVVPLGSGEPALLDADLVALPSSDDPRATIFRSPEGHWLLEMLNEPTAPLRNAQVFEVAGRLWRFCCPERVWSTALATASSTVDVRHLKLVFHVSRDEEFVEIRATYGQHSLSVGSRAFNYLLLTLARRRIADADSGLPQDACGWVDQADLEHDPSMTPPQINNDIFRIRRHFAAHRIPDAPSIIERRVRPRQLRLGTGLINIVPT